MTANVTFYANTSIISELEMSLNPQENGTLVATWNTSEFLEGNYSVWVYVHPLPPETNITDNSLYWDSQICITIPGDVDADFDVDIFDIVRIAFVYSVSKPDFRYDANLDLDGDGDIDIFDIVIACGHYGESL